MKRERESASWTPFNLSISLSFHIFHIAIVYSIQEFFIIHFLLSSLLYFLFSFTTLFPFNSSNASNGFNHHWILNPLYNPFLHARQKEMDAKLLLLLLLFLFDVSFAQMPGIYSNLCYSCFYNDYLCSFFFLHFIPISFLSWGLSNYAVVCFSVFVKSYVAFSPILQFSLFLVCSMTFDVFLGFWFRMNFWCFRF